MGTKQEIKQPHCLCGKTKDSCSAVWEMRENTGASTSSFLEILGKLLTEEKLVKANGVAEFSDGFLCIICRDFLCKIDMLQQQLRDVKNSVLQLLKNSGYLGGNVKAIQENAKNALVNLTSVGEGNDITKDNDKCDTKTTENGSKKEENEVKSQEDIKKPKLGKIATTNAQTSQNIILKTKRIPKETQRLKEYKTSEKREGKEKDATTDDEVYLVEALLEKRGYKYLVKWENYPEPYNSWEPRFALPKKIVEVYPMMITILMITFSFILSVL